ncbi:hypothetical protein [Chamaesiphon minutus]|uniref:Nuclease of the RecB family n=1 Tax=Chamaesiphon minutus (strain ATCC 27169 / PCC 6605) TaxID=1173020 RepID=K9UAS8_CHAP6|nr:hypothetical protein [Chamaesiphon minutus]AFY92217.1 hypothetical protein Cha6605_0966 [Chamaesiphon minutus PCC 6605]
MPIYTFEHQNTTISKLDTASFNSLGILERQHLQSALKNNIQAISPHTLIIAEEFCEWDDSNRRIDLLGIDRDGNIIVVELKRDVTGAHMELQALRYAAMVSTMNFSQAVDIYQKYLGHSKNAENELREFLNWEEEKEAEFPKDVRIVLAAADFSKEIATAVMWLNQKDLDIRCVRMKPYKLGEKILLDIEQIIPLPEAQDYQIRVKQQAVIQKAAKTEIESNKRAKYRFEGNIYGAGQLVLAVIKKTYDKNPDYNLEKLQQLFPKSIQGTYDIITTTEDAERIQQKTSRQLKRHFLNSQDIIRTSDNQELAVCKEWSRYGTNHFIQQIPDELGYIVEIISDNEELN